MILVVYLHPRRQSHNAIPFTSVWVFRIPDSHLQAHPPISVKCRAAMNEIGGPGTVSVKEENL